MQYQVHRASEVSRHVFQKLITLWLMIIFMTFAVAFLITMNSAKADVIVPLPEAELDGQRAILKVFTPSPTPAIIQQRCQSHLHPQKAGIAHMNLSSWNQRNAENQDLQTVVAVRAYRQCASQIALEQLASK